MKILPLNKGKFCLVDDADFAELSKWNWYVGVDGYALRMINYTEDGVKKQKQQSMHRYLMGNPDGLMVDHIDGLRLNNCRSNLRVATAQENSWNRGAHRWGTSKYRGVHWHKKDRKWQAAIRLNGKQKYIGSFGSEEDAATAYNIVAEMNYGEFARMNKA